MPAFRPRLIIGVIAALFLIVVLADALGVFDRAPYTAVPHGDHVHYVPKDRDPSVSVGQFPTQEPEPGQRITPTGEVVPE